MGISIYLWIIKPKTGGPIIPGLFGLFLMIFSIYRLFVPDYSKNIILGDNSITIVKKAICCRKLTSSYQKNDLSGAELTFRTEKRRVKAGKGINYMATFRIHDLFLNFKTGQREVIFHGENYYEEEMNFLVYYIKSYINNQIIL